MKINTQGGETKNESIGQFIRLDYLLHFRISPQHFRLAECLNKNVTTEITTFLAHTQVQTISDKSRWRTGTCDLIVSDCDNLIMLIILFLLAWYEIIVFDRQIKRHTRQILRKQAIYLSPQSPQELLKQHLWRKSPALPPGSRCGSPNEPVCFVTAFHETWR